MYSSLGSWCVRTFTVHRYAGRLANGDISYVPEELSNSYYVDNIQQITDSNGQQVISNTQVYMPAEEPITVLDLISFDKGPSYKIHRLSIFTDVEEPSNSLKVVYL